MITIRLQILPAPFSPQVGDRIADRFELESRLRGQGTVRVFSARDRQADRGVSILLVDPERARANAWGAFAGVVTTLASARITGLVLPQGIGSTAPTPPYCLEEPETLCGFDRLRDQGPLPWQRALALGERAAEILQAAHAAAGVAHRALTPSRCAITVSDDVRVLDYGVAELERGLPDESGYRAPEQQQGGGDPRSDIYTLGLLLFELITGRNFAGATPPSLSSCVAVPRPVDEFFARVLSRDPAQRYPNVATMRAAMRGLLNITTNPTATGSHSVHSEQRPAGSSPATLSARILATPASPASLAGVPTSPPMIVPPGQVRPGPTPGAPPVADRTEIVVHGAPAAPAVADRTEIVVQRPPAAPPVDRTEIVAQGSPPVSQPADRTEVLAPGRQAAPTTADRTEIVRPVASAHPAARTGQAPQWPLTGPPARTEVLRPATTVDPRTERVPMPPLPADTTLLLPSTGPNGAPPQALGDAATLVPPPTATTPPDPLKKALIWINVVCFTAILLVLCLHLLS